MSESPVRLVPSAAFGRVASIMSDGFRDDPMMGWILGGRPDEDRLRRFMVLMAGPHFFADHLLYATDDDAAASIWAKPGRWRQSVGDSLRSLPAMLRLLGMGTFRAMGGFSAIEAKHPPGEHWYLLGLAVRRARQGQGLGGRLLADGLARHPDADRLPAYLESSNPRNLGVYRRAGFATTGSLNLGGPQGPLITAMYRDTRSPA